MDAYCSEWLNQVSLENARWRLKVINELEISGWFAAGQYVCSAAEETIRIPESPKHTVRILWDFSHSPVFLAFDRSSCVTYVLVRASVAEKRIEKVGMTSLIDRMPLKLYDGELCLHGSGGRLTNIVLDTHAYTQPMPKRRKPKAATRMLSTVTIWQET